MTVFMLMSEDNRKAQVMDLNVKYRPDCAYYRGSQVQGKEVFFLNLTGKTRYHQTQTPVMKVMLHVQTVERSSNASPVLTDTVSP